VARAPGARHRRWNVRPHAPKAARGRHRRDGKPHNLPLQFLSETGIFGFILFLGIALAGAGGAGRDAPPARGEDRLAAAALVVGLFAYVVHGVVDFDWDFIAVTAPAVAVLGVLLAAGRPAHRRLGAGVECLRSPPAPSPRRPCIRSLRRGLRLGASTTPTRP